MYFKMLQTFLLFCIGLAEVYPCYGQSDTEYPHNYHVPKMIERILSRISSSQDLMSASSNPDVYKDLFPADSFKSPLKDLMAGTDKERCFQDMEYFYNHTNDTWGLKMLDAFGKPESAILEGNTKWLGNYHECTGVHAPPNDEGTAGDFNGRYCTMDMSIAVLNKTIPITMGICVPDSCSSIQPNGSKDPISFVSPMGFNVTITKTTCQPTSKKLTSAAVAMIVLLSFVVFLSLVGSSITVYEYISKRTYQEDEYCHLREHINEGDMENQTPNSSSNADLLHNNGANKGWYGAMKEFFNCFCVFTNGEKLLNTDSTEGQLLCLHGIRFLSMAWVIVCHTYISTLNIVSNVMEAMTLIDTWLFQVILNGYYSVDSFFLLSGFLVSHLYFQESAKGRKVSWIYFYIHRFVRLTPVYMMVLGFHVGLKYYMGSGPLWTTDEVEPICRDYWWYNILYINNFAPLEKMCMGYTWYLANDMQFFVISPIFLISLWRWPSIGYSVLGIFMSVTVAANFGITYHYSLRSGFDRVDGMNIDIQAIMAQLNLFYDKIYDKPYARLSPYLVGIAFAYYLFKRKQNKQGKLHWITLTCGWIIASALSLVSVFCLYRRQLSLVESGFYNAFCHASFTCGISWVIFTCLNGQGGPVNSILSFKLFIPLSRLTYCTYLIHPLILFSYFGALKVTVYFSHFTMVITYLGLLVIAYTLSFIVSVLFESPIIRLEKLVRTKLMS